jgi:phosphate transport system substrate-binding protein
MAVKKIRLKRRRFVLMSAIAAVAATLGVSVPAVQSQSKPTIVLNGSSTVFPIAQAVAEEFQLNETKGATRVTVAISGTGGGFKAFCAGRSDIANASRPIKAEEAETCKKAGIEYIELPVAYDALTVVVNPRNNRLNNISVAELKTIWEPAAQGKVMDWGQVRPGLPGGPLKLYGPGADSGTFDYFTEAINGKSKESRTDYTGSEDDEVLVQGVSRDENALGYFGYAYYAANQSRLKALGIDGGKGPVLPSRETVENGTYQPLSRPIFIYVKAESANRPEVQQFIEFFMRSAPKLVEEVQYIPLPPGAYAIATENFRKRKLGTAFGEGKQTIGLKIEDLLRAETEQ